MACVSEQHGQHIIILVSTDAVSPSTHVPFGAHVEPLWMKPTIGCPQKTITEALRSKTTLGPT